MSAAKTSELVLLKQKQDGSYLAYTVTDPGIFVAVPESASAWTPWPPTTETNPTETKET
jgi:hypothetical protein